MTGRVIMKCSRCHDKFSWNIKHMDSLLKCPLCSSITDFIKVIELFISRPARPSFSRGKACMDAGKYARAVENFTRALDQDSNCAPAYYYRGRCYRKMKEYNRAIADFNWLIRLDPAYASAYYYRGKTHRKNGNRGKAFSDMEKYMDLEPYGDHAVDARKIIEAEKQV